MTLYKTLEYPAEVRTAEYKRYEEYQCLYKIVPFGWYAEREHYLIACLVDKASENNYRGALHKFHTPEKTQTDDYRLEWCI